MTRGPKKCKVSDGLDKLRSSAESVTANSKTRPGFASAVKVAGVMRLFLLVCLALGFLCSIYGCLNTQVKKYTDRRAVKWKPCGSRLDCATVPVPFDYRNSSDRRQMFIAVTRLQSANVKNRKGLIFVNPGGPGGSGTAFVKSSGLALSAIVEDQYDLIGFDPRGVGQSRPYVSCTPTELDTEAFSIAINNVMLNLPANLTQFSDTVEQDVLRQVAWFNASIKSLATKCGERTGDALAFLGTEFVARDLETMTTVIEGPHASINFWGFSYGTVIGQYLVKTISAERIGRVIIDGVVDPISWSDYANNKFAQGPQDLDNTLYAFATSCLNAGPACALNHHNFMTPSALLSSIDDTIDKLYISPTPIFGLGLPAVATSANLRVALLKALLRTQTWDVLAQLLNAAIDGDYTVTVQRTLPIVNATSAGMPDVSHLAGAAIFCSDAKPYSNERPPPSNEDIRNFIINGHKTFSHRMEKNIARVFCHHWDTTILGRKSSRYNGTFGLTDGTLQIPMLILSNTFDSVSPLENAVRANQRLGDNARLVQQIDGYGHATISHPSSCTSKIIQEYMLRGRVPAQMHTLCKVDLPPFTSNTSTIEGIRDPVNLQRLNVVAQALLSIAV